MKLYRFKLLIFLIFALIFINVPLSASNYRIAKDQQFYRELNIPGDFSPGIAYFQIDEEIYQASRGRLSSIRILDSNETVKPYSIRVSEKRSDSILIEVTTLNRSFNEGRSRMEIDTGSEQLVHNSIRLVTSSTNFLRQASVEGSDDRLQWWILKKEALIFSFEGPVHQSMLDISYPDSTYRYLRVTVEGTNEPPVELNGASLYKLATDDGLEQTVHDFQQISQEILKSPSRNRFVFDLRSEGIPHSNLTIVTSGDQFYRETEIFSGNHPDDLKRIDEDHIFRFIQGAAQTEKMNVTFPESTSRYLAIEIINYDDAPLEIQKFVLSGAARIVYMDVRPEESLQVFYGGNAVENPRYDFDRIFSDLKPDPLRRLNPGPQLTNPEFQPDRLEQLSLKPYLSWAVLAFVAAVLGTIAIRQLRSAKKRMG